MSRSAAIVLASLLAATACDLPRDSAGTVDRLRHGTVRVGVVPHAPWVVDSGGTVSGIEAALAAELARGLDARVEWVRRPEEELLQALHRRELDLVIGGLTADLPCKKEVAFTRPYYTDTVVVGAPPGTAVPSELQGLPVAVEAGDATAADLRKEDAVPVVVRDLAAASGLVAAPSWRLPQLHRASTGIVLRESSHVLAAPKGENAWLVRIERHLRARQDAVPTLLASARL